MALCHKNKNSPCVNIVTDQLAVRSVTAWRFLLHLRHGLGQISSLQLSRCWTIMTLINLSLYTYYQHAITSIFFLQTQLYFMSNKVEFSTSKIYFIRVEVLSILQPTLLLKHKVEFETNMQLTATKPINYKLCSYNIKKWIVWRCMDHALTEMLGFAWLVSFLVELLLARPQ